MRNDTTLKKKYFLLFRKKHKNLLVFKKFGVKITVKEEKEMSIVAAALGAAGISAAASLGGGILQGYYNKKAASKANDYALYSWNLANEYNHPAEQMKRYKEAGLNPNLIYGQQNTTSAFGTTGPAAPDVQGAVSRAADSIMNYYTIQNMKKSNDKLNAEIAGINAGIQNQKVKTASDMWDLIKRIEGGYGSDSGSIQKNIGGLFSVGKRAGKHGASIDSRYNKTNNMSNSEAFSRMLLEM